MRTVVELLVCVAAVILVFLLLAPVLLSLSPHESYRRTCDSNLTEIAKACITYQEPNDDYFPAFAQSCAAGWRNPYIPTSGQGSDGTFQPMPSLASLYPAYIDDLRVFGCPSTADNPQVADRYYHGLRHTCFGFTLSAAGADADATGDDRDPAAFTGAELSGNAKCSYLYDELTNPRTVRPSQAICADADGQTWKKNLPYPAGWTRRPRKPNHSDGQVVMYYDGHVEWQPAVYCSADAADNIFCPNSTNGIQWDPDTDAYLWDGVNSRPAENHNK